MPTGLFKTPDQSAQVEYDGVSIPIPRSTYEKNGYKPDFDKLPSKTNIRRPRRSCVMPRGPKGNSPPRADCYLQDHP
jgi:hypothetical protein